jgi:zinc resistance-associated protein
MRKLMVTAGILVLVGFLAAPVLAHRWGGGQWSGDAGPCWQDSGDYATLTESQRAELQKLEQKFFNDTAKLRDQIWEKSAELNTLLNSPEPDAKKVRTLQKEVSNLRAQMGEQRINFELEARKIAPNARYGRGYAKGYGRGYGMRGGHHGPHGYYGHHGPHGGYGPGGRWN